MSVKGTDATTKTAKQHTDKASADATVAGKVIVNMYRTIITKFTYYINLY